MKFIGIILLLLTSIFLIACSANQASNKINNSELENLASKYGGVYIFNQKFVEEIEKILYLHLQISRIWYSPHKSLHLKK